MCGGHAYSFWAWPCFLPPALWLPGLGEASRPELKAVTEARRLQSGAGWQSYGSPEGSPLTYFHVPQSWQEVCGGTKSKHGGGLQSETACDLPWPGAVVMVKCSCSSLGTEAEARSICASLATTLYGLVQIDACKSMPNMPTLRVSLWRSRGESFRGTKKLAKGLRVVPASSKWPASRAVSVSLALLLERLKEPPRIAWLMNNQIRLPPCHSVELTNQSVSGLISMGRRGRRTNSFWKQPWKGWECRPDSGPHSYFSLC